MSHYSWIVTLINFGFGGVDLGLPSGTIWAKCNVGASSPEEYGLYFSWGNVIGNTASAGASYSTTPGNSLTTDIPSNSTYDAARKYLGGNYRMPTKEEMAELFNSTYTQWSYVTVNDVNCHKIQSKVQGYTDNYILLPCGGYYDGTSGQAVGTIGFYWMSTIRESPYSYCANLQSGGVYPNHYNWRYNGCLIRGVY